MSETDRISFERTVDWVEGRLTGEEAAAVARRVAENEESRAEAEWLRAFVRASGQTILTPLPTEVRRALTRRFEARAKESREPGILRRIVATLSFDSHAGPALGGARGIGAQDGRRQLAYATDAAEVVLDLQPRSGGNLDLDGQIFPKDEPPESFSVQLLRNVTELGMTTADELGEFSFESVPPGACEMLLSTGHVEILISPVELRV